MEFANLQVRCQAINLTKDDLLPTGFLVTKCSDIWIKVSVTKIQLKFCAKWRPFCLALNITVESQKRQCSVSNHLQINCLSRKKISKFRITGPFARWIHRRFPSQRVSDTKKKCPCHNANMNINHLFLSSHGGGAWRSSAATATAAAGTHGDTRWKRICRTRQHICRTRTSTGRRQRVGLGLKESMHYWRRHLEYGESDPTYLDVTGLSRYRSCFPCAPLRNQSWRALYRSGRI